MSQKFKILRETGISPALSSDFPPDVFKFGILRKLKKMKRKFFVLRKGVGEFPSKLEYYPSEKKFRFGCEPKQTIILKTCFNISRKLHPKHKFVICLYNYNDCFSIVLETEEEMNEWLSGMLQLQLNEIDADEELKPRLVYEHVWQVVVDDRELESQRNLSGPYCLGLTSKSLSLIRSNQTSENIENLDFPLMSIRRCGHSGKHFFIELGRSAVTGAGGIWMETEGTVVAQNMHETILGAMKSSRNKEDSGAPTRPRSASTSENSKPIATRRPVGVVLPQPTLNSSLCNSRERCDTMPSRARTTSENVPDAAYGSLSSTGSFGGHPYYRENSRPHSVYAWSSTNSPTFSNLGSFGTGLMSTSLYSNSSSISFPEPESPQENHLTWCTYPQSADSSFTIEPAIREVTNEYLIMSPTDANMNTVSTKVDYLSMNSCGSQSEERELTASPQNVPLDYMDMRSPSSSEGYVPMSTIGSLNADVTVNKKRSNNSISEVGEKLKDGYVPMAPCGASEEVFLPMQDGYLSMSPLSTSLPKQMAEGVSNWSSLNGSNATLDDDSMEFRLDKVQSLLKHTENENDHDFIKPVRTYSIGNRSQIYEARARAYSMGSERRKPNPDTSTDQHDEDVKGPKRVAKSCSAPLLQEPDTTSHEILPLPIDHGTDLMEIDFRKCEEHLPLVNRENIDSAGKKLLQKPRPRTSSRSSCSTVPLLSLDEINERAVSEGNDDMNEDKEDSASTNQEEVSKSPVSSPIVPDYMQMSPVVSKNNILMHKSLSCPKDKEIVKSSDSREKSKDSSGNSSPLKRNIIPSSSLSSFLENSSLWQGSVNISKNLDKQDSDSTPHHKAKIVHSMSCSNGLARSSKYDSKKVSNKTNLLLPNSSDANSQGDYINLVLSKPRCASPESLPASHKILNSAAEDGNNEESVISEPNYINIKLGKPYTPLPNPALVTSGHTQCLPAKDGGNITLSSNSGILPPTSVSELHSYQTRDGMNNAASTPSKASGARPRSFCLPSFPVIRKQMSAPAVPPSLQPEIISPGRKSSCPVTGSLSMVRPASSSTSNRLFVLPSVNSISGFVKRASLRSPDHSMVPNLNDAGFGSKNSSPKSPNSSSLGSNKGLNCTDSQYENVCLPASNSRPSSVGSEKELNYASLDLAPAHTRDTPHSPSPMKLSHQTAIDDTADEPLTYAEIDFTKSEGLRHTSGAFREGRL